MSKHQTPAAVNDFVRLLNECPVKEVQDAALTPQRFFKAGKRMQH
jgi:hypothetical protein